jgi:AbrB family looped-hinge helix DNA binding protein
MAKVTSKLQVTVPKAIAEQYGIHPGDHIDWTPAGDAIRVARVTPRRAAGTADGPSTRLKLFDQATARQQQRQAVQRQAERPRSRRAKTRGWRREELYDRGRVD